jgi:hypothetical protein
MVGSSSSKPYDMNKITTIGELRKAISQFGDEDVVYVEIHEGERQEDLYEFTIDSIDGIQLINGKTINEVRLCI